MSMLMLFLVSKNWGKENKHTVKFLLEYHGPINVATH